VKLFSRRKEEVAPSDAAAERVLVLTPVKNAEYAIERYIELLHRLTYPRHLISIAFLEGDSSDRTYDLLRWSLPKLQRSFRRAMLWKRDFGFQIPEGLDRYADEIQAERRAALAKARNHLLFHALDNEDWVLWMDVDLYDYPPDAIERMLATGKDIVHPNCVTVPGGASYDRNAWSGGGKVFMETQRDQELVRLESVGGTMLLVRADLHRDGLVFPPFYYGAANKLVRSWMPGEIETEGMAMMAHDMGYECWGLPQLEIQHQPF
jgi:glycosyltransferase involved in cell wall biosynthesis